MGFSWLTASLCPSLELSLSRACRTLGNTASLNLPIVCSFFSFLPHHFDVFQILVCCINPVYPRPTLFCFPTCWVPGKNLSRLTVLFHTFDMNPPSQSFLFHYVLQFTHSCLSKSLISYFIFPWDSENLPLPSNASRPLMFGIGLCTVRQNLHDHRFVYFTLVCELLFLYMLFNLLFPGSIHL